MRSNDFSILLICVLFVTSLFICTACSSKDEKMSDSKQENMHQLYKKVAAEREKTRAGGTPAKGEEAKREKQVALAEKCLEKYTSCLEKCQSTSCEAACQNALAVCEKDLPSDIKTIK